MRTAKFWCFNFLILFASLEFAAAQTPANLNMHLSEILDSLKKADNLTEWLYTRIDYSYNARRESLSFLMKSQRDSWRNPKSTAEKEAWLMLLSNQGYNQLYSGNILESINSYEKAYNYWKENNLNTDITDFVLKPWSNCYTRLGDYEKALFIQQKMLDFAKRNQDDALLVSVANNIAISYRSLGDFKKAEQFIKLALEKNTKDPSTNILLNNTLADLYKDKNEIGLAESIIKENIESERKLVPDVQTAYWLLSSYITAGDIQLAKQNFMGAQKYYDKALRLNEKYYQGNRVREKSYVLTQLGKIKLAQKNPGQSIVYFNQSLSTFDLIAPGGNINENGIFGDNRLIDVFYQKALACLLRNEEKEALKNIRYALLSADKIRFELADVKTKQRFQSETKQIAEKAIEIAFGLLEKTGQYQYAEIILDIAEQSKARTLLDDIKRNQQQLTLQNKDTLFLYKQNLERAIAYNEKEFFQHPDASIHKNKEALKFKLEYIEKKLREKYPLTGPASLGGQVASATLLANHPVNTHLIEFFCGKKDLYLLEIKNKRIKYIKKIINASLVKKTIKDFVGNFYHNGPTAMMNQPETFFKTSNTIYKSLLGGINFKQNEKIIIIPDEVLGYLSFDGLITEEKYSPSISNWPYLIKKAVVSYAFSLQTLGSSSPKSPTNRQFTGLFVTQQQKDKQFIPAVAKEAESIKKIISGDFLMDKDATLPNFFNAFNHANVLHISTHAYLSGAQQEPTLSFGDKEVYLFELSANQHAPDLVVLNACRTADGIMASGEGIISLSRGFTALGTQGSIAGLWNVNDEAAAILTADIYQQMLNGKTPASALHKAKLNWLSAKHNGEQDYLPYYWDALVYMGRDQKIELMPAPLFKPALLYGLTGVIILLTILWRLRKLPSRE